MRGWGRGEDVRYGHGLRGRCPDIQISHASHYQLSNRIAFAWKLASLGVPTVIVYLGFLSDTGIRDVGTPLDTDQQWQDLVKAHLHAVGAAEVLDEPVAMGTSNFWLTVRRRSVIEMSPRRPV